MKKILNILPSGDAGGIERLCGELAKKSKNENHFYFMWRGGIVAEKIASYTNNIVTREFSYKHFFKEYENLRDYICENKIEIVVVQFPSPIFLIYLSWLVREKANIKIVIYLHADPIDIFTSKAKVWQFRRFNKYITDVVSISNHVTQKALGMFDLANVKTIYNGVDINKFSNNDKYLRSDTTVNLIYVGRLIPEKGLDLLFMSLKEVSFGFELLVVGEGPCRKKLENLALEIGLASQIKFCGQCDNVPEVLKGIDFFIHPATWEEGFGISIVEAMAAGIPCIAFRRGAVPEIITDNVDGFLIDEVSERALTEKIQYAVNIFAKDTVRYEQISSNARERAKFFSIEKYIENLDTYLDAL